MILLDGKATSQKILDNLKPEVAQLSFTPRLDFVLVGDDPASLKYDEVKQSRAASIGITGNIHHLPQTSTTDAVVDLIKQLNHNPEVTALMVQLPLPPGLDTQKILNTISPLKDADGLTAFNLGLLFENNPQAIPSATALGVLKLFQAYDINPVGKNVVVINNTPVVGLPLAALLTNADATVTIAHEKTQNLPIVCQQADIVISAVGKGRMIKGDYIKPGAIVVDIGLSPDPATGKLIGDIDFETIAPKCTYLTPVPGGTGPMTIASLLWNTVQIAKSSYNQS